MGTITKSEIRTSAISGQQQEIEEKKAIHQEIA